MYIVPRPKRQIINGRPLNLYVYIVTCQAHPVLVKIRQIRCAIRSFKIFV